MFGAIYRLAERIQGLDEHRILNEILEERELQAKIVQLNKDQLLAGINSDQHSLPKYEDDSYFKTIQAAKAYEAWKAHVSPNGNKDRAVMDFYIDGTFHETIKMKNNPESFQLVSDSNIAEDVQDKTNNKALGLNRESINQIIPEVRTKFIEKVRAQIFI